MSEVIHREIRPGERLRDVLAELRQKGGFSEIRLGGLDGIRIGTPTRLCNGCTFCCMRAGVNVLKKPPMVRCQHLHKHKGKCRIYRDRPSACEEFQCAWTYGNWREEDRPDKIGAYVAFFEEDDSLKAVVQAASPVDWYRLNDIIDQLTKVVPRVDVVLNDGHVKSYEAGRVRHGEIAQRRRGDFESSPIIWDDPVDANLP